MSGSYYGESVPPGVAADALYQKGATSVARLLQIVSSLKNELELRSRRVATPIWIPKQPVDSVGKSGAFLACPECLRPYPRPVGDTDPVHHASCPYCLYRIRFAVVLHTWNWISFPLFTSIPDRFCSSAQHSMERRDECLTTILVPILDFLTATRGLTSPIFTPSPAPAETAKRFFAMNAHPSVGVNPPGPTTAVPFVANAIYELKIDTNGDGFDRQVGARGGGRRLSHLRGMAQ